MAGNSLPSDSVNPYFNSYTNSLFAVVEKQIATRKKTFVHRLVYVSRICPKPNSGGERSAIAEYYEQFLSKFQKNTQAEGVTGILLLYPKRVIHLLESSSEVLTQILEDLTDMEKGPNSALRGVRILVSSPCIMSRMFPSWGYGFVTPPLSLQDPSPQTQPVETLVPECLAMIYKLCERILLTDNHSVLDYHSSIRQFTKWCEDNHLHLNGSSSGQEAQEQALLLDEDTLLHLCQSSVLHSPSSFLQTYTKPTNILMDSEIVWPTHQRLYW